MQKYSSGLLTTRQYELAGRHVQPLCGGPGGDNRIMPGFGCIPGPGRVADEQPASCLGTVPLQLCIPPGSAITFTSSKTAQCNIATCFPSFLFEDLLHAVKSQALLGTVAPQFDVSGQFRQWAAYRGKYLLDCSNYTCHPKPTKMRCPLLPAMRAPRTLHSSLFTNCHFPKSLLVPVVAVVALLSCLPAWPHSAVMPYYHVMLHHIT